MDACHRDAVGPLPDTSPRRIRQALCEVRARFPFPSIATIAGDSSVDKIRTIIKHTPYGARVLDYGCGTAFTLAILRVLGYECYGVDDLQDAWYAHGDNREKIVRFARESGVELVVDNNARMFDKESFDAVLMHGVIEHLHDSPRELLNDLVELLRPGGMLHILVPNAVNIRKRLHVLIGRTNHPPYASFYWYPGHWRGHVREYTRGDLRLLVEYLGLEPVHLCDCHRALEVLHPALRPIYRVVTSVIPGSRDTWSWIGKKPHGWQPRRTMEDAHTTDRPNWQVLVDE